jgi:hypothetical protein
MCSEWKANGHKNGCYQSTQYEWQPWSFFSKACGGVPIGFLFLGGACLTSRSYFTRKVLPDPLPYHVTDKCAQYGGKYAGASSSGRVAFTSPCLSTHALTALARYTTRTIPPTHGAIPQGAVLQQQNLRREWAPVQHGRILR